MEHSRCSVVAIVVLILTSSSSGAPTSPHHRADDRCLRAQDSSSRLNTMARLLSNQTGVGIAHIGYSTNISWIETQDMCDPASLGNNAMPCMLKMSAVLRSYHSTMETLGQLTSCSDFIKQIEPTMRDFYNDMQTCANATGAHLPEFSVPAVQEAKWNDVYRCHNTMKRLFSFSVVGARVFALGDPACHGHGHGHRHCHGHGHGHGHGPAAACM